jgi:glycosyltransferase involved in cell wall biosynthesis
LKLYEYMASGRPVVAAAHPDARRLVKDGSTGFLFETGSRDSLKAALTRAWRQQQDWPCMGEAARDVILREHTWSARVSQMVREIEARLLGQAGDVRQHAYSG